MRHIPIVAAGAAAKLRAVAADLYPLSGDPSRAPLRILQPGRNCWRVEQASRAAVLIDAADYFSRLEQALLAAGRLIVIIGWDFDAAIRLTRGHEPSQQLGAFLRSLVDRRPELEIRILVWNLSTLHAPSATLPILFGEAWHDHPRIKLRLDSKHPAYAAQHEKIIAVDESIAFVGGMDLTVDRWDTSEHFVDDARRKTPSGTPYGPIHDVQFLVEGDAAARVSECARDRWAEATGETVPAARRSDADLWPAGLQANLFDVPVGIARTRPRWKQQRTIDESAQLVRDAIARAERSVYIEAQYFTDFRLGDVIARRLKEPHGPEFVIIVTRTMHGFIEGLFMNGNRHRLVRRLRRADMHNRLRVYHPVVPAPEGECQVLIHAKVLIVDDDILRIGSANFNNRSTGLDLECDLGAEGINTQHREGVAAIRSRLLSEHLGTTPEAVAQACVNEGSMIRAIERLNVGQRRLVAFEVSDKGPIKPVLGTRFVDPPKPSRLLAMLWRRRRSQPKYSRGGGAQAR
jgi:phosphatidylserine/phosphatidylglycerophosphate/cardiolipin synthase-like enzyme